MFEQNNDNGLDTNHSRGRDKPQARAAEGSAAPGAT